MTGLWDPVSYRSKRYFENLLALGIISAMALIFFTYVNRLSAAMEQASIQQTLSMLRQGIQFSMFTKMVDGDRRSFAMYENRNPFAMLGHMPDHYAGEYSAQDGMQVPAGRWYFELDSRQAVYRFMHQPLRREDAKKEIRLSLQFEPADGDALSLKLLEVKATTEDEAGEN